MTATSSTEAEAPDVSVTSYAVRDGVNTARVVLRDSDGPLGGGGPAWLVALEHRHGVAVADESRLGDGRFVGGVLDTHGEIPVPTPDDLQRQLAVALGYARDLLDFYREHDDRLEKALAVSAAHLHRIRTVAGCVDR